MKIEQWSDSVGLVVASRGININVYMHCANVARLVCIWFEGWALYMVCLEIVTVWAVVCQMFPRSMVGPEEETMPSEIAIVSTIDQIVQIVTADEGITATSSSCTIVTTTANLCVRRPVEKTTDEWGASP